MYFPLQLHPPDQDIPEYAITSRSQTRTPMGQRYAKERNLYSSPRGRRPRLWDEGRLSHVDQADILSQHVGLTPAKPLANSVIPCATGAVSSTQNPLTNLGPTLSCNYTSRSDIYSPQHSPSLPRQLGLQDLHDDRSALAFYPNDSLAHLIHSPSYSLEGGPLGISSNLMAIAGSQTHHAQRQIVGDSISAQLLLSMNEFPNHTPMSDGGETGNLSGSTPTPGPSTPHDSIRELFNLTCQLDRVDSFSMVAATSRHDHLLGNAFDAGSFHPSPFLSRLLDEVLVSSFLRSNVLEPLLGDGDGIAVLADLIHLSDFPPITEKQLGQSLYTLFVSREENTCLICGKPKASLERALGCVRAHLGQKPFGCVGCGLCTATGEPARFTTAAYLRDHVKGQKDKKRCVLW